MQQRNSLDEEEKKIKEQLKYTSYETLLKLNSRIAETSPVESQQENDSSPKHKDKKTESQSNPKKKSKNKPIERSARIPVSTKKVIFEPRQREGRDPRFDGLSGKLNEDLFNKSYGFIREMKKRENETLGKAMKRKGYSQEERERMRMMINTNRNELTNYENSEKERKIKSEFKKKMAQNVGKGLKPFFPKKKIIKTKLLEERFEKLEKTGKLESYITKKHKQRSDRLIGDFERVAKIKEMKSMKNQ